MAARLAPPDVGKNLKTRNAWSPQHKRRLWRSPPARATCPPSGITITTSLKNRRKKAKLDFLNTVIVILPNWGVLKVWVLKVCMLKVYEGGLKSFRPQHEDGSTRQ